MKKLLTFIITTGIMVSCEFVNAWWKWL